MVDGETRGIVRRMRGVDKTGIEWRLFSDDYCGLLQRSRLFQLTVDELKISPEVPLNTVGRVC
jgi:hypothetical protein